MDLRRIFMGIGWFCIVNLVFYLFYPMFKAFMTSITDTALGDMAMGTEMAAISWLGFLAMWFLGGVVLPIYLVVKGASSD